MSREGTISRSTLQIYREACEECHQRKIRCVPRNGPCDNCVSNGRDCIFRQRSAMGRPRKQKPGQRHNSRLRLVASNDLSMSNAKQTEQENTAATVTHSIEHRRSSQQPREENERTSNDMSNNDISNDLTNERESHIIPSSSATTTTTRTTATANEAAPYSFNKMTTNYPLNLPDVEFDSDFDYSADNIISENIHNYDAFGPSLGLESNYSESFCSIIPLSSTILFELRRLCDRLFSLDMVEVPTDLSDIFKHVSRFCGLVLPKVSNISLPTQRWEETQTAAQLIVMIVSTAMKCYGLLAQRQKDLAACSLQSKTLSTIGIPLDQPFLGELTSMPAATSSAIPVNICPELRHQPAHSHSSTSSSSLSTEGGMMGNMMGWADTSSKIPHYGSLPLAIIPDLAQLKRQLETVMHFTIMDYHTAQFQWILAYLVDVLGRLAVAGFQGFPLDELARLQKEAIELRGRIQSLTQEVRESYFT